MKQKITIIMSIFVMLLGLLPLNKVLAVGEGYTIDSYNINLIVNENNSFDITETITANFIGSNKHGIYRKIPLKNSITRLDGTTSNNLAQISNISVDNEYTTRNESGYKVIKIGNAHETVKGLHTYTIKYTYNIGKDPLEDTDELYFNLIGPEWDTSISNVKFTITMPKEFDKSLLGFSTGKYGSTNSSNVEYSVADTTITGSLNQSLYAGEALTVRLSLPEGYFVGAHSNFDSTMIIKIAVSILLVFIAFVLWKNYGKDDEVVETVEFYPPDGLNSAELGFYYKGASEDTDIISLLIYLANKGYLKIEEYEESTLKVIKTKNYKIVKLKEYDGTDFAEKKFFEDLFKYKDEVTKSDLYNKFYITLKSVSKHINRKENQEKIFEKASLGKRIFIILMILVLFLMMNGLSLFAVGDSELIMFIIFILGTPLSILYTKPNLGSIIFGSIALTVIPFFCMIDNILFDKIYLVQFIIQAICMVGLVIFLGIMKKRTQYGTEILGKIKGFKRFLETAEKEKLEALVEENPEYFYNILPYTYVLGVSNKWMSKFEDIALEPPTWYYGYSSFNTRSFNRFMNSTYSSISSSMSSHPSSSGGGSSGGGFSGGGSGGGGGGSW